jgi:beta-phosphoglucomutase-like phosphatase (HAD superfamily)
VTVCGDEVAHTKPDPEPYLAAAAALGVPAAACVAVEDSPAGVASAVAAGCAVIAVPNEVALTDVDGLVLSSLAEADLDVVYGFFARSKAPLIDIG